MEVLTVLAGIATIAALLYITLIGQKSIPEWLRELRARRIPTPSQQDQFPPLSIPESEPLRQHHYPGGSEQMLAVMKLTPEPGLDLTTKKIPPIGSKDILIRVSAASICGTDWNIYEWRQWSSSRVIPPVVIDHEFCGVVVDRGNEVTEVSVGDLVSAESHIVCGKCSYCQSSYSHVCPNTQIIGVHRDGAFAEFISIPATNAWKMPSDVPVEIAAIIEPFGNAVHAALSQDLTNRTVLIAGCGPQGIMATALAKWAGARTVCVADMVNFRLQLAQKMGADVLLNSRVPTQDLQKVIMESTEGQGIDVFLEMSGSPTALSLGLSMLRHAGRAVVLGYYGEPIKIDADNLITSKGITVYGAAGRRSDQTWERMRHVLMLGGIDLKPLITHEFSLDQIDKVFELLFSREVGKVIIRPVCTTTANEPKHLAPASSVYLSPGVPWHDGYERQAKQLVADSRSRELQLLLTLCMIC